MSSRSTPNSPSRATPPPVNARFAISRVPRNPLGESNYIRTAAALIIGCVLRNLQAYALTDPNVHMSESVGTKS